MASFFKELLVVKDRGHTVTEHLTEYLYCPTHKRQANLGIQNNY